MYVYVCVSNILCICARARMCTGERERVCVCIIAGNMARVSSFDGGPMQAHRDGPTNDAPPH